MQLPQTNELSPCRAHAPIGALASGAPALRSWTAAGLKGPARSNFWRCKASHYYLNFFIKNGILTGRKDHVRIPYTHHNYFKSIVP